MKSTVSATSASEHRKDKSLSVFRAALTSFDMIIRYISRSKVFRLRFALIAVINWDDLLLTYRETTAFCCRTLAISSIFATSVWLKEIGRQLHTSIGAKMEQSNCSCPTLSKWRWDPLNCVSPTNETSPSTRLIGPSDVIRNLYANCEQCKMYTYKQVWFLKWSLRTSFACCSVEVYNRRVCTLNGHLAMTLAVTCENIRNSIIII